MTGDKFMPELHLRQPGFTCSACGPFTKNKERIQKIMQTGDTIYIYKNDLDKASFQRDMTYGKYKDLEKRTQSDKVLADKGFEIANNPKCNGYQRGLPSIVYRFFQKSTSGRAIKNEIKQNQQLANKFQEPIIMKSRKRIIGVLI